MGHAVAIKSTNETAAQIELLWDACGKLEEQPSMRALGYPPHISLGIYEDASETNLKKAIDSASLEFGKFEVTFDELRTFESEAAIVLWAKPRQTSNLIKLHERIHSFIDPKICRFHYQPENWIAHCTLATDIPASEKPKVDSFINENSNSFDVVFDVIDLVSFFPIEVMHEKKLQGTL